jgi:hypothetical protein
LTERHILSKSTFLRGVNCKKSLYLNAYQSELRDPLDESAKRRMLEGRRVGELARERFPGGVLVQPGAPFNVKAALARTQELIKGGTSVIYEAALQADGVLAFVDILVRGDGGWRLYEVKSTTKVKEEHLLDVALQVHLLKRSGLDIEEAAVLHINRDYLRQGELDLQALYTPESVFEAVNEVLPAVAAEIEKCKATLGGGEIPEIGIGPHCTDPVRCDFYGHCWAHIPIPSVFDVSYLGAKKYDLYERGIVRIEDIPDDFPLSKRSSFHVESHKAWRETVDRSAIRTFLDDLAYPLYFLDFETFSLPIPPFDDARPYLQIPFQYSLHIQRAPGAEVEHSGFLAEAGTDPRLPLLERLLAETEGSGSIVVYSMAFEKTRLRELAEAFPTHANALADRIDRLEDLMVPFRERHLYKPEMGGSYSIKAVLPALVPDLSYEGLEISDGTMASDAYLDLWDETDPRRIERVRDALWEYCKLDTLAMVRILERLYQVV